MRGHRPSVACAACAGGVRQGWPAGCVGFILLATFQFTQTVPFLTIPSEVTPSPRAWRTMLGCQAGLARLTPRHGNAIMAGEARHAWLLFSPPAQHSRGPPNRPGPGGPVGRGGGRG